MSEAVGIIFLRKKKVIGNMDVILSIIIYFIFTVVQGSYAINLTVLLNSCCESIYYLQYTKGLEANFKFFKFVEDTAEVFSCG